MEHHFAHASGEEYQHAAETALHLAAKDILAKRKEIVLPEVAVNASYGFPRIVVAPQRRYAIASARGAIDEAQARATLRRLQEAIEERVGHEETRAMARRRRAAGGGGERLLRVSENRGRTATALRDRVGEGSDRRGAGESNAEAASGSDRRAGGARGDACDGTPAQKRDREDEAPVGSVQNAKLEAGRSAHEEGEALNPGLSGTIGGVVTADRDGTRLPEALTGSPLQSCLTGTIAGAVTAWTEGARLRKAAPGMPKDSAALSCSRGPERLAPRGRSTPSGRAGLVDWCRRRGTSGPLFYGRETRQPGAVPTSEAKTKGNLGGSDKRARGRVR